MQTLFMNLPFRAAIFAWTPPPGPPQLEPPVAEGSSSSDVAPSPAAAAPATPSADEVEDIQTLQRLFAAMQASDASGRAPVALPSHA